MKSIFDYKNYHFIGIGGIGISAIAKMLHIQGKNVTGSDSSKSEITQEMEDLGIKIFYEQNAHNINKETEVVIYTVAIKEDNPELKEARKQEILCLTYPETLGELSKNMFTIAISGTHGKTTTTAMVGHILQKALMDPTIIVGSKMIGENGEYSNFHAGKSKYLVVEACEYKRSFLNLYPDILAITNIEEDHLDYYKNITDIKNAFGEMIERVKDGGFVVTDKNKENIKDILIDNQKLVDASLVNLESINLKLPGEHNIENAQIAISIAKNIGIEENLAKKYLKDFKGTWRRLELKFEKNGNLVYDDYAHHPTEIKASLKALKQKYKDKKLICIFEPHQQSRTKLFLDDFATSFENSDLTLIAPIFITREIDDKITTNKTLVEVVNKYSEAETINDENELLGKIKDFENFCVVFMGAGDIYKWTNRFINRFIEYIK